MGRYESLNSASKDVVDCLLPGIAANFGIAEVVDVIPEDIRMRVWDVERREHVTNEPENDPRNWGLQFLKDLVTISRIKKGQLEEFQEELRKKVEKRADNHPWAKLVDIKEIKEHYEAPPVRRRPKSSSPEKAIVVSDEDSASSSSYLEELVEKEESGPKKRGRRPIGSGRKEEVYKSRRQSHGGKPNSLADRSNRAKRLRRSSSAGWERPDKVRRRGRDRRPGYVEGDEDLESGGNRVNSVNNDEGGHDVQDMSLEELELMLQVAEAELATARLRHRVIQLRRNGGRN